MIFLPFVLAKYMGNPIHTSIERIRIITPRINVNIPHFHITSPNGEDPRDGVENLDITNHQSTTLVSTSIRIAFSSHLNP